MIAVPPLFPEAPPARAGGVRRSGPSHRHEAAQRVFIAFGGRADQWWLRLLAPGFRHCFAAIEQDGNWTVLDPLTGRLLLARLDLPADYDLPAFYRRAGMRVLGPFNPSPAGTGSRLILSPFSCVSVCRAVLGASAPFAWTPHGLY